MTAAPAMANLRFTALQSRPPALLNCTSVTLNELQRLVLLFESRVLRAYARVAARWETPHCPTVSRVPIDGLIGIHSNVYAINFIPSCLLLHARQTQAQSFALLCPRQGPVASCPQRM